jgi:uroporphyrinogen-III decarboxylase
MDKIELSGISLEAMPEISTSSEVAEPNTLQGNIDPLVGLIGAGAILLAAIGLVGDRVGKRRTPDSTGQEYVKGFGRIR